MPDEPLLYQCLHVTERPNRPAHGTRRHLCEPTPGTSISRAVVEHTRAHVARVRTRQARDRAVEPWAALQPPADGRALSVEHGAGVPQRAEHEAHEYGEERAPEGGAEGVTRQRGHPPAASAEWAS